MKRTLAILLAIMMLFSFAACANKPAETPTDEPTEPAAPEKTVIIVTPSQKQNSKGETWQAFIKEQTEHIV